MKKILLLSALGLGALLVGCSDKNNNAEDANLSDKVKVGTFLGELFNDVLTKKITSTDFCSNTLDKTILDKCVQWDTLLNNEVNYFNTDPLFMDEKGETVWKLNYFTIDASYVKSKTEESKDDPTLFPKLMESRVIEENSTWSLSMRVFHCLRPDIDYKCLVPTVGINYKTYVDVSVKKNKGSYIITKFDFDVDGYSKHLDSTL